MKKHNVHNKLRLAFTLIFIILSCALLIFVIEEWPVQIQDRRFNVLLITFDALRHDHLGVYGYARNTSPNIDEFAGSAILFDSFFTNGAVTFVSLPSILSSRYPHLSRINNTFYFRIDGNMSSLQANLKKEGYSTYAIINNNITFTHAVDGFDDLHVSDFADDRQITKELLDTLQQKKDKPFFIWTHYISPHYPYEPIYPYNETFYKDSFYDQSNRFSSNAATYASFNMTESNPDYYISQYDGEIKFADNEFGKILSGLEELGLASSTIIIITSDHGESLGEHDNYFFHGPYFDENFRVPMILYVPGLGRHRGRIDEQLSSVDIYPTILEMLQIRRPDNIDGSSFYGHIFGNDTQDRLVIGTLESVELTNFYRYPPWKYVTVSGEPEALYDLDRDPDEKNNLVASYISTEDGTIYIAPEISSPAKEQLERILFAARSYEKNLCEIKK